MDELSLEARLLNKQIAEAFSGVAYPGDQNLYDGWQLDDDYHYILAQFTGKRWQDFVPERRLPRGRGNPMTRGMCFLGASAWHFFLPAYLIAELKVDCPDGYFLRPPSGGLTQHIEQRYERLSAEQRRAVIGVLEFADARVAQKQANEPGYRDYYQARRQELAVSIHYWQTRPVTTG